MKKTYIQPATLLTAVGMHQMICTSNPRVGISRDAEDAVDAGNLDSRRSNSLWDDEE